MVKMLELVVTPENFMMELKVDSEFAQFGILKLMFKVLEVLDNK